MAGRNSTYGLVLDNTIMNIIDCQTGYDVACHLARAAYGDTAFAIDVNQWTCGIGDKYRDGQFYYVNNETGEELEYTILPTNEQEISSLQYTTNNLKNIVSPTLDTNTCTLDEMKKWWINLTEQELSIYLQEHPLVSNCHANKYATYTITKEKQALFTSKYTAHLALISAGINDEMIWNESGKTCEVWTDNECVVFISEWNKIVSPLVSQQQNFEIIIKQAVSKEEINSIDINYFNYDIRNISNS